jgi:hypothetical protein
MENYPTLDQFHRAMYAAHPGISIETVTIMYQEKYPTVTATATEIQPEKKSKKKK